jgi:acyl carrier protein
VLKIIGEFLDRREESLGELSLETPLYADGLGLDSAEAAELSATVEDELGSDPFSAGEILETVADVVTFYETASSV